MPLASQAISSQAPKLRPPPPPSPTPSQRCLHLLRQANTVSISYTKPLPATTITSLCRPFFHHQPTPSSTPSSPSSPAPSLLDLQSSYILRNVSFTALPGELLAVVSSSGAGKSTLLDILSTRITPTSGSLYLNSSPLQPSSFRRLSSHLPQHDSSLPHLTVSKTFFFAARLLSAPPSAVASLLSEGRLSHLSHERLPGSLSGGELCRVSVGLSLLSDPKDPPPRRAHLRSQLRLRPLPSPHPPPSASTPASPTI